MIRNLITIVVLIICVVGSCIAETKYHQANFNSQAINKLRYQLARFPNHPSFPNNRRSVNPKVEAAQCKQYWFPYQIVDHFGFETPPLNITNFNQRYFVCDGFWNKSPSAPIFFYLGNESDVELYVNNTGLMYELAPNFGALLVFAEHRYFGQTQPFGTQTPNYMNYLSMEQALADYAHFLPWFTTAQKMQGAPIIGFGGSYGGMLAAWFRMKYPGSIDGVIAGSAPIVAFLYIDPPYSYNSFADGETADASPAQGSSEQCVPNVRSTFQNVFELGNSAAGRKELTAAFNLCSPLNTVDDADLLASWIKSAWDFMTMGNYPYESSYMTNGNGMLPPYPTRVACEHLNMTNPSLNELFAGMNAAISIFYNVSKDNECYDIHASANNQTTQEILYWSYIACTEIFIPQGQDGVTDMFWSAPFNLQESIEACQQMWGVTPRIEWISETYGGYAGVNAASNIFFSNGAMDPWHGGGILQNISSSVVASLMPGAAHHLDLFFSNPLDPQSVIETRLAEKANIQAWINEKMAKLL